MKRKLWFSSLLRKDRWTVIYLLPFIICLHCSNENSNPLTPYTGTATDIDGNVYQTVKIGDQWWMAENLKVTHYRNGDTIPSVANSTDWVHCRYGATCIYDNQTDHVEPYGRLYNWYAVHDTRNIAPDGWHVPGDEEWKILEMFLGMSLSEVDLVGWRGTNEGGKLKESGTALWQSPNTGATNESGFTGLPAGCRYFTNGSYTYLGFLTTFWSSTEFDSLDVWGRDLNYGNSIVYRVIYHKGSAFSVRCIKDQS